MTKSNFQTALKKAKPQPTKLPLPFHSQEQSGIYLQVTLHEGDKLTATASNGADIQLASSGTMKHHAFDGLDVLITNRAIIAFTNDQIAHYRSTDQTTYFHISQVIHKIAALDHNTRNSIISQIAGE